ncbi:hypothetical protein VTN02DRAFT_5680 [Thermoascus thermophilus]
MRLRRCFAGRARSLRGCAPAPDRRPPFSREPNTVATGSTCTKHQVQQQPAFSGTRMSSQSWHRTIILCRLCRSYYSSRIIRPESLRTLTLLLRLPWFRPAIAYHL